MNVKRVRELVSYLVSMAAVTDAEVAKQFADELEDLLPPIVFHDVDKFYPDNRDDDDWGQVNPFTLEG